MMHKEDKFIQIIQEYIPSENIGDDVAYIKKINNVVISTDHLIENVHFSWNFCTAQNIANKLFQVNLSDILVKNGTPKYALLNLAIKPHTSLSQMKNFSKELGKSFNQHGVTLIGGDTTQSATDMYSLTLLGTTQNLIPRVSNTIKKNDKIYCLGEIGMSQLAYEELQNNNKKNKFSYFYTQPSCPWEHSHTYLRCKPKVSLDQSDSMYESLKILAEQNKLKINIDLDKIPLHKKVKKITPDEWLKYTLISAEDLSWIFITKPIKQTEHPLYCIGNVLATDTKKSQIDFYIENKKMNVQPILRNKLYTHFK